ncbi:hypothetical protein V8E54_008282 [Elaphomyces granulatus]
MNDPNDDSVNDESQLPPEHLAEAEAVPRLPPGNALERGTKLRATTILLGISYWQSIRDGADFLIGQCFHHSSPKSNSIGTDFWELNLTGPERRIAQLPDLVNKHHKVEYMSSSAFTSFGGRHGLTSEKQSAPGDAATPASFFQPSDYYNLRTLPEDVKYPEREWPYDRQREWIGRLQTRGGGRGQGGPDPESGLLEMTPPPRKFMQKLAGFRGNLFPAERQRGLPPLELTRLIWPEVDDWLVKMEAYRPKSRRNRVQRRDLAGPGFLRLLRILKTVKADVFVNEAYQAFPTVVAAASEAGEEPEDLQLKKVLPVLYDKITMMHQDLKQPVKLAVSEVVKKT